MNNKYSKKIQTLLDRGLTIPYEEIFASYSKKEQEEIKRRSRFLMAAMELRRARKQEKLTQVQLAKKMNVQREFISRIESGRQNITLVTLYHIGDVLGKEVVIQFK